jgi:hypothetical protein
MLVSIKGNGYNRKQSSDKELDVHYTQGLFEAAVGKKNRHTKENDRT